MSALLTGLCIGAAAIGLIGCQPTLPPSAPECRPGAPACPISISVPEAGVETPLAVRGHLSAEIRSVSYRFCIQRAGVLSWSFEGPAAHLIITSPSGEVDGPGISREVRLPVMGCYVLGLSSNTMAEHPYGDFVLTLVRKQ
jgi:hypothetical protein